jgi:hypothetical protein
VVGFAEKLIRSPGIAPRLPDFRVWVEGRADVASEG